MEASCCGHRVVRSLAELLLDDGLSSSTARLVSTSNVWHLIISWWGVAPLRVLETSKSVKKRMDALDAVCRLGDAPAAKAALVRDKSQAVRARAAFWLGRAAIGLAPAHSEQIQRLLAVRYYEVDTQMMDVRCAIRAAVVEMHLGGGLGLEETIEPLFPDAAAWVAAVVAESLKLKEPALTPHARAGLAFEAEALSSPGADAARAPAWSRPFLEFRKDRSLLPSLALPVVDECVYDDLATAEDMVRLWFKNRSGQNLVIKAPEGAEWSRHEDFLRVSNTTVDRDWYHYHHHHSPDHPDGNFSSSDDESDGHSQEWRRDDRHSEWRRAHRWRKELRWRQEFRIMPPDAVWSATWRMEGMLALHVRTDHLTHRAGAGGETWSFRAYSKPLGRWRDLGKRFVSIEHISHPPSSHPPRYPPRLPTPELQAPLK